MNQISLCIAFVIFVAVREFDEYLDDRYGPGYFPVMKYVEEQSLFNYFLCIFVDCVFVALLYILIHYLYLFTK